MPALQVREFPDELYEELRAYAARNHRSIAQQTIACVENEIRRSKALETAENDDDEARIVDFIPANVREASVRAQAIDPFKWLDAFGVESEEMIETRRSKRERLRQHIAEMHESWNLPDLSCEETARMIREDRDDDHGHVVFGIDDVSANPHRKAR